MMRLALVLLLLAGCGRDTSPDDPLVHRLDNIERTLRAQAEVLREWQLEGYPITVHVRVLEDGRVAVAVPDSADLARIEQARDHVRKRRLGERVPPSEAIRRDRRRK